MKTTKELRGTYKSLFAYSQSPLASFVKHIIDDLEAAEAELQRLQEQTQWRPIETAPKDGETIIAVEQATASNKTFLGRRVVTSIYWEDYWKNSYSDGRVENGMWEVILWQPFPLPPQAQENERE